jgi:predicted alpha/beta superfamily hydrolase
VSRRLARRSLALALSLALAAAAFPPAPTAAPASAASGVAVRVRVAAPASTPARDTLWLSGDLPALGAWNAAGLRLRPAGGDHHEVVLRLPAGTRFEYKVTRGSWDTVEKDARGGEIGNRALLAVRDTTVDIAVATWRDQGGTAGPAAARTHSWTGDIRFHPRVPSAHVQPRDVWVWLPPGYAGDSTRRHPVLYFHDGNNVFDRATSFLGMEWAVDETAQRLVAAGDLPPFIAVAVANTDQRMAEYTPARDVHHGGGRAADYARFLIEELKPFVDSTYRTDPRPAATGTIGSSLGAVVSLWLGLEHPETFTRIGVVSPATWFADHDLVRRTAGGRGTGLRIWLDLGTAEGAPAGRQAGLAGVRTLRDALLARGYREGIDLHYAEVAGGVHDEDAWAARVEPLLRFLLAPPPAP